MATRSPGWRFALAARLVIARFRWSLHYTNAIAIGNRPINVDNKPAYLAPTRLQITNQRVIVRAPIHGGPTITRALPPCGARAITRGMSVGVLLTFIFLSQLRSVWFDAYRRLFAVMGGYKLRLARVAPAEAGALADLHDASRRSGRIASVLQQVGVVNVSG